MTTGQIQAPSAFELWWEKNRRNWTIAASVTVAGVLAYYGWRYYQRSQLDATWSSFATSTNLRKGYAEKSEFASWISQQPQLWGYYLQQFPQAMFSKLDDHIKEVDDKSFDEQIAAAKGTDREPLILWMAANRAMAGRNFDRAKTLLKSLQTQYATHFLCAQSSYPPQHRVDLNEGKKDPAKAATKADVKLAEPVAGSLVGQALERVEREEKFAADHASLYKAPEPDGTMVAVVKTDLGEFKIGFFDAAAAKHVATFIELAKNKHFDKMAIDQISRAGERSMSTAVQALHFGLVSTRDNVDRTKWTEERNRLDGDDVKAIEWENSAISHFPLMVAASAGKDGKSIPGRVHVCLGDASSSQDGRRVVFGKVIAGEDVVRKIILDSPFTSEEERQMGTGSPRDVIVIQSITIEPKS
jgi:cyclophilin family peptidyl-prolyl cis-trans isomerase